MVKIREDQPLTKQGAVDIEKWLPRVVNGQKHLDLDLIKRACNFAQDYAATSPDKLAFHWLHQGLTMAEILGNLSLDTETITASILFNLTHDTNIPFSVIKDNFPDSILKLIKGVIRMDAIRGFSDNIVNNRDENQAEKIRKMLLAMAEDVRVVLIRLAEHICELRSADKADREEKIELAQQTQSIYAPLANRLGVGQIKWELEDLAFRYLEPTTYKEIARFLDEKRIDREKYVACVVEDIKQALSHDDINADVAGRAKHIYSIWRKMKRKNLSYNEIYDIRAVRILTDKIQDCYAALGIVHSLWRHIPKEFDDYIATPKENGYQSLHTAVIGPDKKIVEIQIRTIDMHRDAELGVAAHWLYKEDAKHGKSFQSKVAWLRQLLEWQDEISDTHQFVEELKHEVFEDRIYVLTPKGDVVDLPENATPLDFAYSVHTEVGHCCRGAKINGRIVPLTYRLKTGDQVEILTVKNGSPSRDWVNQDLKYITTARARNKVLSWFKRQNYDDNLQDGKLILEKELNRLSINNVDLSKVAKKLNFKLADDVYVALGRGDLRISQILSAAELDEINKLDLADVKIPIKKSTIRSESGNAVLVSEIGNILTSIARCCKPIPDDSIIGYITYGRGISVHRADCANIKYIEATAPERLLEVRWNSESDNKSFNYQVDITVLSNDRHGLLRDLTNILSIEKVNITNISSKTDKNDLVYTNISAEIDSRHDLDKIIAKIERLPNVIEAKRKILS